MWHILIILTRTLSVSCTPLLSSFVLGAVVVPRVFSETMDLDFRLEPGELTFGYTAEDSDAPLPH